MIKIILGGIGSGKSLTATKKIYDMHNKDVVFTNFKVRDIKYTRLKYYHIIEESKDEKGKIHRSLNWEFWNKMKNEHEGFHVYLDEIHNIMHSRLSMTKQNVLMSSWVAQIRKILGGNEKYDLVCISQELERIDVSVRDLTNEIILCKKFQTGRLLPTIIYNHGKKKMKMLPEILIICYYFKGSMCTRNYLAFRDRGVKTYNYRTSFLANVYFRYFDSYELIDFGQEGYL